MKNIYVTEPKMDIKINLPTFSTSNPIPSITIASRINAPPTAGTNPRENLLNHQALSDVGFAAVSLNGNIKLNAKAPIYSPSEINIGASACP